MTKDEKVNVMLNEGVQVHKAQTCLFCREEGTVLYELLRDRLFGAPGTWSLMRCPKCELVWLTPRPLRDDIGQLYAKYFTHETPTDSKRALANLRKLVKDSILKSRFGYSVDGANSVLGRMLSWLGFLKDIIGGSVRYLKSSDGKYLLDVGCGNGQFLVKMRELGWEVMGVEPDAEAVGIAREKFGIEVFQGPLKEARLPDNSFDAITMNHVIEHVPDPIGLLRECRRVLKPGGRLVVITPNIKSLGRCVFSEYWRGWEVPRHLFLFSPGALRVCAERARLIVQELRSTAKGARWMWTASWLIKRDDMLPSGSPQKQNLWLRLEGLAFQVLEHGLSQIKDAAEELILIATK